MNTGKYQTILFALAETIEKKNAEISILEFRVKDLKEKLAAAEYHLNPQGKERPKCIEVR